MMYHTCRNSEYKLTWNTTSSVVTRGLKPIYFLASGADPLILSFNVSESVIQLAPQATALKSIVYDV